MASRSVARNRHGFRISIHCTPAPAACASRRASHHCDTAFESIHPSPVSARGALRRLHCGGNEKWTSDPAHRVSLYASQHTRAASPGVARTVEMQHRLRRRYRVTIEEQEGDISFDICAVNRRLLFGRMPPIRATTTIRQTGIPVRRWSILFGIGHTIRSVQRHVGRNREQGRRDGR